MEEQVVIAKMVELAKLIDSEPNDISFLKKAMKCQVRHKEGDGKNRKNYTNDSIATLGDSILKFILSEQLFNKGFDKAQITQKRIELENNGTLYRLCNDCGIIDYAYNDTAFYREAPEHNRVPNPTEHSPYIEAIIGAIYKDRGMKYCKKWVITFFSKK